MGDSAKSQLDSILKSVVSRDSTGPADTMLVSAHLPNEECLGSGRALSSIRWDNFGRSATILFSRSSNSIVLMQAHSIWDRFLAYGKGLFYIRPTEKTYRIYWFDRDSYRTSTLLKVT